MEKAQKIGSILSHSKNQKVTYYVLTEDRLEAALDVMTKGFYPYEPICTLYEISKNSEAMKEFNNLAEVVARDNISLMAIDDDTNELVGVCFNKKINQPKTGELAFFEKYLKEIFKNKTAINVLDFMCTVDEGLDIFEKFNVSEAVELAFLAVSPTHRGRGIGSDLLTQSMNYIKANAIAPVVAMIGTSSYTIHMGKKLQFQILAEESYKNKNASDSVFNAVTKLHNKLILFVKQL